VILPLYRSDEERGDVLPFCDSLKKSLTAEQYDGEPLRVRIDDRDLRGGDKKWQWIKKGVPLIVEVGPRDIASNQVMVKRRDTQGKGVAVVRDEFVNSASDSLAEIQQSLFDRAARLRTESSVRIDSLAEFECYCDGSGPGGLAYCPFADSAEMEAKLKELKCT